MEAGTWCVYITYTSEDLFLIGMTDVLCSKAQCFYSQDHRLNDLHCINLDTWEWSEMCVYSLTSDKKVFRSAVTAI